MNGRMFRLLVVLVYLSMSFSTVNSVAIEQPDAADLYMKDTPMDIGTEPNPDTGPMWVTEDIWVRTSPDPNYSPLPFAEASPPWSPLPHQNPEYRDPKYGLPNYVYVRIRNRGSSPTSGTERLKVYWAKASTGLSWPTQWVDYLANNCGPTRLFGAEITKPRKNAGTATPAERTAYKDAILSIGTLPSFVFPGGSSYWSKQNEVHSLGPANRHGSPAFLPWHREFINRYEALLQEADPTVKLLYWDWTTDPENTTGGVNLFTSSFMGASGRGTGGVSIGLPFIPALSPPSISRNLSTSTTPPADSDASIVGSGLYQFFEPNLESVPNHNSAHGYIGGGGNISFINIAAQDPFFFMLHANVDRLWAQWQRDISSVSRLASATAYDGDSANANITTNMAPWDGTGTSIRPWTVADGYIVSKTPKDASVVSPPVYDTAPLVIPVLQPGQAVVIQIPWYPPNPANFSCFGGDQGHFCLLARIETALVPPYGMSTPEGSDVNANTRNNNNIAWKNITVVDNFPGPLGLTSILIHNVFKEAVLAGLRFADTGEIGASFFDFGTIKVDLKPELFRRWDAAGRKGQGVEAIGGTTIQIFSPQAFIQGLPLEPDEAFSVDVYFELKKGYQLPAGVIPKWDLIQTGAPGNPDATVGGQRFELDFQRLTLVGAGTGWRYLDDNSNPGASWNALEYDDTKWKQGQAELGFGDNPVTTIDGGPADHRHITTYFRRSFDVSNPSFFNNLMMRLKRDDGAVVYLNGKEIYRVNMPAGPIGPDTLATANVEGLEEEVFFPIASSVELASGLQAGQNVIAVEIHQAAPDSPDLSFDLEFFGNPVTTKFPPSLRFSNLEDGDLFQLGQVVPVEVEALDGDGKVVSVSLQVDGSPAGTDNAPPFSFQWQGGALGSHRLRATATDQDGLVSAVDLTLSILTNTPPIVALVSPADEAVYQVGEPITLTAQASDPGGSVQQVEFIYKYGQLFSAPEQSAGIASIAPYQATLNGLPSGEYMLVAYATDSDGAVSSSIPVHIMVEDSGKHHFLPLVVHH